MIRDAKLKWLLAILMLALPAAAAEAAMITTVPVGNTGNSDDIHGDGYGAVTYNYNIGTYEVTAGQYTEFLSAVAVTDTYGLYNGNMWSGIYGCKIQQSGSSGSYSYTVAPDWANRPVNYVSWGDAARFANWMHNGQGSGDTEDGAYYLNGMTSDVNLMAVSREADWKWAIPTEDEWYKAAYHKNDGDTGNYYLYPTSSDSVPSNNLTNPDSGNNATFNATGFTGPYYRTEVGDHENSESPYGTFDQGGNVWEWNEAVRDTSIGSYRGLRGGSFGNLEGTLRASDRYHDYYPTVEYFNLGFRVASSAAIPEPGSVLVWAGLGVIGLIWFRHRK